MKNTILKTKLYTALLEAGSKAYKNADEAGGVDAIKFLGESIGYYRAMDIVKEIIPDEYDLAGETKGTVNGH